MSRPCRAVGIWTDHPRVSSPGFHIAGLQPKDMVRLTIWDWPPLHTSDLVLRLKLDAYWRAGKVPAGAATTVGLKTNSANRLS